MRLSRNKIILSLVGIGLVLGVSVLLVWLDRHPVHVAILDDTNPEAPAVDAFRETADSVVLISSLENLATAARHQNFDRMDWSLAWINLLEQEVGAYAHLEYERVGPEPGKGRAVVIVAGSAAPRFSAAQIESLRAFVNRGGVLVLDRPGPTWATLSGIELGQASFSEAHMSDAAPDILGSEVRKALAATTLPFPVSIHTLTKPAGPDVENLLSFDEKPALVARRLGQGAVISTTFDPGRLLVTMQQGKPEPTYQVQKRWGYYDHVLESHDLVWHQAYLENAIPAADVLERTILAAIRRYSPLPCWWAFPGDAMGLLLMTHDEDEYGSSQCQLLLDHEKKIGARSTFFLMTGRRVKDGWPPEAIRSFADQGADLELHWKRDPWLTGIWKLEPISRVFSLADQIDFYRGALEAGGVTPGPLMNRNHYLMWASDAGFRNNDTDYTRTFRVMYRHGVVMDATYGPNRQGRGYLFGTGRPFYPMDQDGQHIPIREMPFVSQEDWGGEDEAWFRKLFQESRDLYHTAICCIFHPHLIVRTEAGNRLWKSVYESAAASGHPAMTFRDYYHFLEKRRTSPLLYRVRPDRTVEIDVDARSDDLSLAVPGHDLQVTVDEKPGTGLVPISLDGQPVTLVPVAAGKHHLLVKSRSD